MNFREYQLQAARTANENLTLPERKLVGALGLVGESIEVLELFFDNEPEKDEFIKEAGDVMWYTGDVATSFGLSLGDIHIIEDLETDFEANFMAQGLCLQAKEVGELVKKHIGQNHPIELWEIKIALRGVIASLAGLCEKHDTTLEEVMDRNIEKLSERYKSGKFSPEESMNRVEA